MSARGPPAPGPYSAQQLGLPGPGGAHARVRRIHYSCASSHPQIIQYSALNNLLQRYLYSSSRFVKKAAK